MNLIKRMIFCNLFIIFLLLSHVEVHSNTIPIIVNTWNFQSAAQKAWDVLQKDPENPIDAIVEGCNVCQENQCDFTVGYGGSPDENGETALDAMIFDGDTMNMGAVGAMRRVKNAVAVAKHILQNTKHSFLVGDLATDFAKMFGFTEESLSTNYSTMVWKQWKENYCQPNFWINVKPDPTLYCGPYTPIKSSTENDISQDFGSKNHDTIGMIAISKNGQVVAGTSTNGASHKIPGRVGDSPIPGAGAYADSEVGAAVATGDGDVMMRFLPSFLAVELMRNGASPTKAAKTAITRIVSKYPEFMGAVLAVDKKGQVGAACNGIDKFPYSQADSVNGKAVIKHVLCKNS